MSRYDTLDIAIALARYSELYDLVDYDNLCKRIGLELDNTLKPLRRRLLRGFHLANTLNNCIDRKSELKSIENSVNAYTIQCVQRLQSQFSSLMYRIKSKVEEEHMSYIDIQKESDPQILDKHRDSQKALDLVCVRNLTHNTNEEMKTPVELSKANMREIGYNNRRVDKATKIIKSNAKELGSTIDIIKRHNYVVAVVSLAITIKKEVLLHEEKDFLNKHSNSEVKEWLHVRGIEGNPNMRSHH